MGTDLESKCTHFTHRPTGLKSTVVFRISLQTRKLHQQCPVSLYGNRTIFNVNTFNRKSQLNPGSTNASPIFRRDGHFFRSRQQLCSYLILSR